MMSDIRFARVFTDGAVLQRGKEIKVWGFAQKGATMTVTFAGSTCTCTADEDGRFDAAFPAMEKGGPFTLCAGDEAGNTAQSNDIFIGDVIIISGQSNMEFPMIRVKETYPDDFKEPFDGMIRTFKVTENGVFGRSIPDVATGEWRAYSKESADDYSAVGYFTAKHIRRKEDVAVGIVDLTLGGVIIEAFMSEKMLEGFDEALAEAKKFEDDGYRNKVLADNETNAAGWLADLDVADVGVKEHYEDGVKILAEGRDLALPDFFNDTELEGFIGSLWIARTFTVPKKCVKKEAMLWLGTITDLDFCYVNGQFVGNTEYCYPPRRYKIPEGLIKEGENTVVVRIGVEKGYGRVTPGKLYGVVFGNGVRTTDGFNEGFDGADHIEPLSGVWKYLIGTKCEPSKETIFVNWKPTALYHGLMEPLSGLSVKAFAFYQGESNCGKYFEYARLTQRFVEGIRDMWGDIPYICVQLPEFNTRMEEISFDHGKGWRGLMAAQEECLKIKDAYLVRAYGCGELNDIHPERKEPVGKSIADIITSL